MRRRRGAVRVAVVAVAMAVVLGACGGGDDTASRPATTGPPTTTAPPVAPPALGEDPEPVVVGHRGAAGHHPDNSLEGFAAARDLGATWVELDVRLSADGVAVLSHDPETAAGTVVAAASADQLADEGVPTLREALDVIDEHALGVDVEIKALPWEAGFDAGLGVVDATVAVLEARPPLGPVVVSSFNRDALDRVRALAGDGLDTMLILPEGAAAPEVADDLAEGGHDGLALEGPDIVASVVAPFAEADLAVWAWTVDDPEDAEALVAAGVSGIVTDLPDVISTALTG